MSGPPPLFGQQCIAGCGPGHSVGFHPIDEQPPSFDGVCPMKPVSDIHPSSVNGRLADYLAKQKENVTGEWLVWVRRNAETLIYSLNVVAIEHHLPHVFDTLIETFRLCGSQAVVKKTSMPPFRPPPQAGCWVFSSRRCCVNSRS